MKESENEKVKYEKVEYPGEEEKTKRRRWTRRRIVYHQVSVRPVVDGVFFCFNK